MAAYDFIDHSYDVVVVGSGAGALTAAWTAARAGLALTAGGTAAVTASGTVSVYAVR